MYNNTRTGYVLLALIAALAVIAMLQLLRPRDEPSTALGRAAEEVSEGFEDAGRELDNDRTPAEKFGDAIEDVGDSIEDAASQ